MKEWHRLASHLGMTVREVQKKVGSKEFVRWKVYLNDLPNEFNALFYYLAAIRSDILRVNSTKPKSIKLRDMILKFVYKKDAAKGEDPLEDVTSNVDKSMAETHRLKAALLGAVGWFARRKQRNASTNIESTDDHPGNST